MGWDGMIHPSGGLAPPWGGGAFHGGGALGSAPLVEGPLDGTRTAARGATTARTRGRAAKAAARGVAARAAGRGARGAAAGRAAGRVAAAVAAGRTGRAAATSAATGPGRAFCAATAVDEGDSSLVRGSF